MSGHGSLLGRGAGSESGTVAGAFDDELVGPVGEPIEGGVGQDRVGEEADPFAHVTVGRYKEAGVAMAFDDQRVEVFGLLLGEPMETEVVDQKQVRCEVAAEDCFEAMVGTGLAEFAQEMVGATEEHRVTGAGCRRTECLREEGLTDTDGTDEEDMLFALEEVEREEFVEMTAVELDSGRPVEVVEGDAFFEAGLEKPPFELLGIATLDFVGEDEREKGGVVELLGTCEGEAVGQSRDSLAKLEAFEEGDEVCFEAHAVASCKAG